MHRLRTSIATGILVALVAAPVADGRPHKRVLRSFLAPARAPARVDVPCANADRNAADATAPMFAGALLCLVNQERARHGLGALSARPLLGAVALRHANSMVVNDFFGHSDPGDVSYRERIRRAGYFRRPAVGFLAGENIAWTAGFMATPQTILEGWMVSPSHRREILDSRYRETGVGVVLASPPSLNRDHLAGATAAMEFGALSYASARVARSLRG
jgi:uncharacterized protein YkwD